MGFSFGAPHAIAAAAAPRLHPEIGGVVGFGGYRDLERTIRFMLTGRHEWNGRAHHLRPDPYGRWIVAGNYLAAVPGLEDALDVTAALRRLAAHAGDVGAPAWDAVYDPFKTEVRAGIAPVRRGLFDLIAPPSHQEPPLAEGERMAAALAAAATAVEPQMDPGPALSRVERPVHVLHGRDDHLLPFTEGLRMRQALPATTWSRATVTRLFGHTARDPWPGVLDGIREVALFLRALHDVLAIP
jgi:pimeloyl-ACP methyl ester carboxylesterase